MELEKTNQNEILKETNQNAILKETTRRIAMTLVIATLPFWYIYFTFMQEVIKLKPNPHLFSTVL